MAWVSVHQEVDGSKLRRLYKTIGCSKFEALGILNFLWFWGMKNADETGLVSDADLEVLSRYLYGCGEGSTLDMGKVVQAVPDAQQLRQLAQITLVWLLFVQQQRHQDILPGRQHRQQIELLENEPHLPAAERGQFFIR